MATVEAVEETGRRPLDMHREVIVKQTHLVEGRRRRDEKGEGEAGRQAGSEREDVWIRETERESRYNGDNEIIGY